MNRRFFIAAFLAIASFALVHGSVSALAEQAPAVSRTVLKKHDLRVPGQEGVMALVVMPPGAREGRHTHPAQAFVYVLEGVVSLEVDGKAAVDYKAGESFFIEAGEVHEGRNNGQVPARAVAVFFAEKGKPLTTQVQ